MTTYPPAVRPGIEPCPQTGFDPLVPIWSSSVALFVTSADGRDAVSLRLCTYPDAGVAWVWVHAVLDGRSWSHNIDHVPVGSDRVDVLGPDPVYVTGDGAVRFSRHGPRARPEAATVEIDVAAHEGLAGPDLPGSKAVRLAGGFVPTARAGGTLPGRSELFGTAEVTLEVDSTVLGTVTGAAQWHEQHQDAPRFVTPFTYASLRGPDIALIALIGPKASGGFARGADGDATYDRAVIPEPADGRHELILTRAGDELHGALSVCCDLTIPVYGRPWWGTIVTGTVDGRPVSGSVNRWRFAPEAEPFTPTGRSRPMTPS